MRQNKNKRKLFGHINRYKKYHLTKTITIQGKNCC